MRKFNFKRVMALVLSVVLLLGVMPISSVMAAPAAQAAPKKVLIWYGDNSGIDAVGNAYTSMNLGITVDKLSESSATFPVDLSGYGIIWIYLPSSGLSSAAISALKTYVNSGGVVVLEGENSYYETQNAVLTSIASQLGGDFEIENGAASGTANGDINFSANAILLRDISAGSTLFSMAAANIKSGSNATVVASCTKEQSTFNFIVEQPIGNGYLIGSSDTQWFYMPVTLPTGGPTQAQTDTGVKIIQNMYIRSVENIESVSSKVLLWSTGLSGATTDNNLNGWGINSFTAAATMLSTANPGITVDKQDGSAMPADLSGYSLVWIHLPAITAENYEELVNVSALKDYLNKGGRVVLLTETVVMMGNYNEGISALVNALGGGFSLDANDAYNGSCVLNTESDLTAGVNDFSHNGYVFPAIIMSSNAQWIGKQGDAVFMAEQAVGLGRLTVTSDFNWYTNNNGGAFTTNADVVKVFENLVTNTKTNMETVANGGNPNADFGVVEVENEAALRKAIADAASGVSTTIKLTGNFGLTTSTLEIAAEKNIVLDLNGKTLSYAVSGDNNCIRNYGKLTVVDSSDPDTGVITSAAKNAATIQNYGDLVVNGGTVRSTGTYTSPNYSKAINLTSGGSGTVVINGGKVEATSGVGIINDSSLDTGAEQVTINGGEVVGGLYGLWNYGEGSKAVINAGSVKATANGGCGVMNNGTLTMNDGAVSTAGTGSAYGIKNSGSFVMNGGSATGYHTGVHNTGTAAIDGGTLRGTYGYGLANSGTATVGGDSRNADIDIGGKCGAANSGTLYINEKESCKTVIAAVGNTSYQGYGIVNGADGTQPQQSVLIPNKNTGTIIMTGGTVKGDASGSNAAYAIRNGSASQDNRISGGTLVAKGTAVLINSNNTGVWEFGDDVVLKNTLSDKTINKWFTNPADSTEPQGANNETLIKNLNQMTLYVSSDKDADGYYTGTFTVNPDTRTELQTALDNAKDGEIIKLDGDIEGTVTVPAGKNVVIDLNGHTISGGGQPGVTNNGTLKVIDSSIEKNGVIVGAYGISNKGTLTVEAGTLNGTSHEGILNAENAVALTVTGGTVMGTNYAICDMSNGAQVTLAGGEFECYGTSTGSGCGWVIGSYGGAKGGNYEIALGVVMKNNNHPGQFVNTDNGAATNGNQVAVSNWNEIAFKSEDGGKSATVVVNTAPLLAELKDTYTSVKGYIGSLENLTAEHKTALLEKLEKVYADAQAGINAAESYADALAAKNNWANAIKSNHYYSVWGLAQVTDNTDKTATDKASEIMAMTGISQEIKDILIERLNVAADAFLDASIVATSDAEVISAANTYIAAYKLVMAQAAAINEVVLVAETEKVKVDESQNLENGEKLAWNAQFDSAVENAIPAILATATPDAVEVQKTAALGTIETYSTLVENANITNLVNSKNAAAKKVDEALKAAKETINGLKNLSDGEKNALIEAAEKAAADAKTNIMACKDMLKVADALADGIADIAEVEEKAVTDDATALADAKDAAIKEIGDKLDEALKAIDALKNLSADEKAAAKKAAEDAAKAAVDAVNDKDSIADVNSAKETGISAITDAKDKAEKDDADILAAAKEAALKDIDEKLDEALKAIDALKNLSADEKAEAKKAAEDAAKAAKDEINGKDTAVDVKAAADAGVSAITEIEADAASDDKVNKFIADYLTDANGNIIKDATDETYKNILAGLDDWNALSDAEKEAVKAILAANGSKAFDDMVKSAEAIKTEKETANSPQTGDNSHIYLWMSIMLISLAALVLLYKKKALLSK